METINVRKKLNFNDANNDGQKIILHSSLEASELINIRKDLVTIPFLSWRGAHVSTWISIWSIEYHVATHNEPCYNATSKSNISFVSWIGSLHALCSICGDFFIMILLLNNFIQCFLGFLCLWSYDMSTQNL